MKTKTIQILFLIITIMWASFGYAEEALTLDDCIALALENNTKIKNSSLEIQAARQVKKSAFTNFFPSLNAGGMMFKADKNLMEIHSEGGNLPVYDGKIEHLLTATQFAYLPASTIGVFKEGTVGYINALQPLFAGGRIINGNKLANLGIDAAQRSDRLTKDEVILLTKEHYWQIIALEEKYKTVEKYEEMLDSLLKKVEDAFKYGIIMKNDVLKVRLKQSEFRLNKSKLTNGISLARMAFNQHLGLPLNSGTILKKETTTIEPPEILFINHNEALKLREEYKLLELSVKAEKLQTKIKRGEYLPQVGVGTALSYLKFDENEGRSIGMIYGSISVPISGWWGGAHEIKKHTLKEQIAENNFKDKSELLLLQMDKCWRELNDAYTQYLISEEAKTQAAENLKVNDDGYKNGLITVSDLLEAQALLREAEDRITEATNNFMIVKTKYLQVTGR